MARITVEDCLVQENNRFSLVQLASKRTKQILQGGTVQITDRRNKAVVTALREIAGGKVRFMTADETAAWEEQRAREAEAQRASNMAERERRQEIGAGLFTNGGETRAEDFLKEALMQTGPIAAASDDDEE
jgi:DNA-directed RNA polymerase subunit omega